MAKRKDSTASTRPDLAGQINILYDAEAQLAGAIALLSDDKHDQQRRLVELAAHTLNGAIGRLSAIEFQHP